MMSDVFNLPSPARNPLMWTLVLVLALLAWLSTLHQALGMVLASTPQFGTMGLPLGPFVLFWSIMMAAMMFPALAPTLSTRYVMPGRHSPKRKAFGQILVFVLGYLSVWTLFGIPVFFLALLGQRCVLLSPTLGVAVGIALLVLVSIYQMSPLEKRFLMHCNPALCCHPDRLSTTRPFVHLWSGLVHGLFCLGCCGALMLVLIAVGLMNLPWMLLITLLIFLEKTWQRGDRLGFFIGFGLLVFAPLSAAEPALLPGLYRPF